MSLSITCIEVEGFRNLERFVLRPDLELTILVGPNAVGKTNLIEAIELLTEADSFRRPNWGDLVLWGRGHADARLHAEDGLRRHDVELTITAAGRRVYRVNGKPKRSAKQVSGTIPCVVFTPEDLRIVKESAERRRAVLDSVGTQLSPAYAQLKTDYERVVRQRNALLKKEGLGVDEMAPWDERLITLGARLGTHRRGLFQKVASKAADIYQEIAEEGGLKARYVPSWERDGLAAADAEPTCALERHLGAKRDEERVRGVTLTGPHRDEIVFEIAGRDARYFASQGQQRTIALAVKLAEVSVISEVSGLRPVLLLDDVMSELDESRRRALAALVGRAAQTVVTTTNLGYFDPGLVSRAQVVEMT